MGKVLKRTGIALLALLLAIVVVVVGYVAYVLIAYHRLEDNLTLSVSGAPGRIAATGETYDLLSWNIGFGAYEADYGFFMDGGTESRAWSEERLQANIAKIAEYLRTAETDFYLVQEVDFDSTRTYHMDERVPLLASLAGYASVFAQNYDSPYLMYPLFSPHGASKAGLFTFSAFDISESVRRSLPIESGFMKLLDLDRCYSVSRIPLTSGAELVLYNFHLSAYTSDGTIATEQLKMLLADMQTEYERGNFCIAGGDFNKDILGNSKDYFGESDTDYTWAQPIPAETFEGLNISLVAPLDKENPVPSCRNADGPYHPGQYVVTVDGFLVTDNVSVLASTVLDTAFAYSDHNPVKLTFQLD
ncbi:MAG: endonuclease/exonuclease/phosphatase family protein [Eubacteriales bacterium]